MTKKPLLTRQDRLSALLAALARAEPQSETDLALRLGKTPRLVALHIGELIIAGHPIEGSADEGWHLVRTVRLGGMHIAETTADKLRIALSRAEEEEAAFLTAMLAGDDAGFMDGIDLPSLVTTTELRPKLAARRYLPLLRRAVRLRQRLRMTYRDGEGAGTRRNLRPLDLERWNAAWALVAWCELREDFRVFRLDRIGRVKLLGGPFAWSPGQELADFRAANRSW